MQTPNVSADEPTYATSSDGIANSDNHVLALLDKLADAARNTPAMSAAATSTLGAILISAGFAVAVAFPGHLSDTEYVATMVVGTLMVLVGPLILARVGVSQTNLVSSVLQ